MAIDWHELFGLTISPLELFIRGSLMYCFLFLVFRTILQRDVGSVGMADVLLLVLVADAAQNAMSADYGSVTDGLVLVATILGWNIALDYLAYRFPRLRRVLQPPKLCLVRDGKPMRHNLRREFMSIEDLRAKLREHGIADLSLVREAYMESDGVVSVIRKEGSGSEQDDAGSPRRPV